MRDEQPIRNKAVGEDNCATPMLWPGGFNLKAEPVRLPFSLPASLPIPLLPPRFIPFAVAPAPPANGALKCSCVMSTWPARHRLLPSHRRLLSSPSHLPIGQKRTRIRPGRWAPAAAVTLRSRTRRLLIHTTAITVAVGIGHGALLG